jgi:hypothetical protein
LQIYRTVCKFSRAKYSIIEMSPWSRPAIMHPPRQKLTNITFWQNTCQLWIKEKLMSLKLYFVLQKVKGMKKRWQLSLCLCCV